MTDKCTRPIAPNAGILAKYHLSPMAKNQSIVRSALKDKEVDQHRAADTESLEGKKGGSLVEVAAVPIINGISNF